MSVLEVNGARESILFRFVSDEPPGFKIFCEPETIHKRKQKIYVLIAVPFYLGGSHSDLSQLVSSYEETITFTLQVERL